MIHRRPLGKPWQEELRLEDGRVFVSGVQAIARLPVDQLRIDRRGGHHTAAFVSGYQGSPLAAFGDEVGRMRLLALLRLQLGHRRVFDLARRGGCGRQLGNRRRGRLRRL